MPDDMKGSSIEVRDGESEALLGTARVDPSSSSVAGRREPTANAKNNTHRVVGTASSCYSSTSNGIDDDASHHHAAFSISEEAVDGDESWLSLPRHKPSLSKLLLFASQICAIILLLLTLSMYRNSTKQLMPSQQQQSIPLLRSVGDTSAITSTTKVKFDGAYYYTITNDEPLSHKSPSDLGIPTYSDRPDYSRPGSVFGSVQDGSRIGVPLPTNEWYLNLVVGLHDSPSSTNEGYEQFANEANRVYTIPYILDVVGPIIGIRLHYPNVLSYGTVVQSNFIPWHGLTLGTVNKEFTRRYSVDEETLPSKLGVGIRWEEEERKEKEGQSKTAYMRSNVLRGMPYGTMQYGPGVAPTIASEIVSELPLIDGSKRLQCGALDPYSRDTLANSTSAMLVEQDVELFFPESDLTWLVFFSKPVYVQCYINDKKALGSEVVSLPPGAASTTDNPNAFQLRVDQTQHHDNSLDTEEEDPLIVRIALANNCTRGTNVHFCQQNQPRDQSTFVSVLRDHANVYPTSPAVTYAFSNPEGGLTPDAPNGKSAYLFFDWGAKSFQVTQEQEEEDPSKELIMFALPHHVDILRGMDGRSSNEVIGHCIHSLHGNACLVKGGLWAMEEELGGLPSFMAPRPPNHTAIPALAKALSQDIHYSLPDYYMRGAGDTYFSGKMLAKLGRIIVIAQELRGLADTPDDEYDRLDSSMSDEKELLLIIRKCKEVTLPTQEEVTSAIDRLKRGVEIWLDGNAETLFTFDDTWGGLVSCGCLFNGQECDNAYPNCPSYTDPGLNFGNGFYNDHHFHYGYHIYAAAIVAQYDPDWGKRYFERIMLLIRDIANPSVKDKYFPLFRQKDWYLGNSWASGIALFGGRPYLNGRNQESSSEAIAAYEGIAMFGSVMMKSFGNGKSTNKSDNINASTACRIFNIGRFLAATEIRSADRYWHVYSPKRDQIYPDSYTPAVVSMMWDTMCQFQTWFGNAPYLAYGIQLLPLTPISERRDSDQWIRQLYPSFVDSCNSDVACINEGWAILLYAVLATLGYPDMAVEKTLALPEDVFLSAGGSGHSLTNTLWYISTRPTPDVPYNLQNPSTTIDSKTVTKAEKEKKIDCGCPATCSSQVLRSNSDGFTCKERIQWLITNRGFNELGACGQVAGNEYKSECGACDPILCAGTGTATDNKSEPPKTQDDNRVSSGCPPCDADVCNSETNRCQVTTAPYLCYGGPATGGCSATAWVTGYGTACFACCELFQGCEG